MSRCSKINSEQNTLKQAISLLQSGQIQYAVENLKMIIKNEPDNDAAYYFLSIGLYETDCLEEAASNIEAAIKLKHDKSYLKDACDIFFDLALLYKAMQDNKKAINCFEKCISFNPKEIDALLNICKIYESQSNWDEALKIYTMAAKIDPDNAEIFFNKGIIYSKKSEFKASVECFEKSRMISPDDAQTLYNLGLSLIYDNKDEESIRFFKRALLIKPDFPEVYLNMGLSLSNLEKFTESIDFYKKALELRPSYVQAYVNLAISYFKLENYEKATELYEKALETEPENIYALTNYGYLLQRKNENGKALELYKRVITIQPDNADAHFLSSTLYLSQGDFERGWDEYEWRFRRNTWDSPKIPEFKKPVWQGEPLTGKTLYVYPEQGLGDAVQFSRFLPLLSTNDTRVIYKAKDVLEGLFRNNYENTEIISQNTPDDSIDFDYYIPLLSIPRVLKIRAENIPLSGGYLKADSKLVKVYRDEYFKNSSYKIGIFWQGSSKVNQNRHISLEMFLPLCNYEGIRVYSFQKGDGKDQMESLPAGYEIVDLGKTFDNFSKTAAALDNIDLLITVDSSVAHLAGAMQKKTLLLLPFSPEWRWINGLDYTPWYGSIKILRQTRIGNWDEPLKSVYRIIKG